MNEIKWAQLTIAADQLDDLEAVRKATQNRLRALCQPVEVDGVVIDKGGPDSRNGGLNVFLAGKFHAVPIR